MQKELIVIDRYKNTDPYWKSVVSNNPVTLDLLLVEEHATTKKKEKKKIQQKKKKRKKKEHERVQRDTLETNLTVTYKIKHALTLSPIFPTPGYLPKRNKKLCSYKNL